MSHACSSGRRLSIVETDAKKRKVLSVIFLPREKSLLIFVVIMPRRRSEAATTDSPLRACRPYTRPFVSRLPVEHDSVLGLWGVTSKVFRWHQFSLKGNVVQPALPQRWSPASLIIRWRRSRTPFFVPPRPIQSPSRFSESCLGSPR